MKVDNEKYLPKELVNCDGILKAEITYKPVFSVYIGLVIGCLLCATLIWQIVILGVFVLALTVVIFKFVNDYKVMDIYDNFLIIYAIEEPLARRVDFADIKEWSCKPGLSSSDSVMIVLNDGEVIYKDTFKINKVYKCLNKLIKEKESRVIKEKEKEGSKLVFKNPFKKKKPK